MPDDADARRAVPLVICYPTDSLPTAGTSILAAARQALKKIDEVLVPPREARCFEVPAGHFFRIVSVEGSQVGDLNLWQADNLDERFYAGKTRALHGTHLSTGDRLWSSFPFMRPLARITYDTLDWYGWDADGGSVHDVIGTRQLQGGTASIRRILRPLFYAGKAGHRAGLHDASFTTSTGTGRRDHDRR